LIAGVHDNNRPRRRCVRPEQLDLQLPDPVDGIDVNDLQPA
jgi:hypothetical protein